jgi:hypothetical protein
MKLMTADVLFKMTHPEEAEAMQALREYLENMYFG